MPRPGGPGRLLLVDDDVASLQSYAAELTRLGFEVWTASDTRRALDLAEAHQPEAVVCDLRLGQGDGLELCRRLHELSPDVPVVVATRHGDLAVAVSALRAKAHDFLVKPIAPEVLATHAEHAVLHHRLRTGLHRLEETPRPHVLAGLVGRSSAICNLEDLLARAAISNTNVLVRGETGTGKELVAQALHEASAQAKQPFVAINCAALPGPLLESELFGHKAGAFTDAKGDRPGLFVQARGGTLFLDEIGDLPLALQPKLLRAIQERAVRPVGSDRTVPIDVRIVAATHRNLEEAIRLGEFRSDLLYRLNVIELEVPPLREREDDILLLAEHFLARYAAEQGREVRGLTAEAAARLLAYDWPGNVRELENCIERAVALTRHDKLTVGDLSPAVQRWQPPAAEGQVELIPVAEVERRHIMAVLDALEGNKMRAAKVLGIGRKTLYRKLATYETQRRR